MQRTKGTARGTTLGTKRDTGECNEKTALLSNHSINGDLFEPQDLLHYSQLNSGISPNAGVSNDSGSDFLEDRPRSGLPENVRPLDLPLLNLEEELQKSLVPPNVDPSETVNRTVSAFNRGRATIMIKSKMLGLRIKPDEYRLVSRNNIPELVPPTEFKMYKRIYATGSTEDIGIFKQTDLYIGANGSHLINVPPGKFLRAWDGNRPILLDVGIHVIHSQNFRKVSHEDLFDLSVDRYIKHGTYHIIQVLPGQVAKIWIDNIPHFLEARDKPYVFNQPVFTLERPLVNVMSEYINHGNHHILRIPQGKVAKVWFGTKPDILEARPDPYIFNDPYFRLDRKSQNEAFMNADEEVIIHGSIKRLMPRTGNVAVTYNSGTLVTYGATGKAILITSATHTFQGFLQINTQTLEFPSERTRNDRRSEGLVANEEEINFEIFRTSDGLPVGVKLLVVFEITDPNVTLHKINQDQIISHIERLVVADMGMVIQNCSSGDFLQSNQSRARALSQPDSNRAMEDDFKPSAPEFFIHLQDEVKNRLHDDFQEYGIKLVRLNVETPKILDQNIANKMAEYSLMTSEVRAKESVMDRKNNIAQQEATQRARTLEIEQKQENSNKVGQAQAELETERRKAEAIKIKAQAEADARLALIQVENQEREMRGKMFLQYPQLLQYEIAKMQAEAWSQVKSMIISPEVAANCFNINGGFSPPGLNHESDEDISKRQK